MWVLHVFFFSGHFQLQQIQSQYWIITHSVAFWRNSIISIYQAYSWVYWRYTLSLFESIILISFINAPNNILICCCFFFVEWCIRQINIVAIITCINLFEYSWLQYSNHNVTVVKFAKVMDKRTRTAKNVIGANNHLQNNSTNGFTNRNDGTIAA